MKRDHSRILLLALGLLAVVAILCSQSFYYKTDSDVGSKAATEETTKTAAYIQAPGDIIPGHSVEVDDSSAFHLITSLFASEEEPELPNIPAEKVSHFFEILFGTLIAPNAP